MNFKDKVTRYSRKNYKAEVHLIAIDGYPCSTQDNAVVERIKNNFWRGYPETPRYLYAVYDTTGKETIGRGYIFYVHFRWAFIVRLNYDIYLCPYPNLDELPVWEAWCQTPAETVARVIKQSRADWGKKIAQPQIRERVYGNDRDCQLFGLFHPFGKADLKKAYRSLCMKHHPDRGGDAQKFREINEAYKRLSAKANP